ncbi:MAG: pentapeptide repeat-containing protein, partial [Nitrospinota bacterium]|nr:pentapeptide repeat-containing protein [Nitrospinota bacterium]
MTAIANTLLRYQDFTLVFILLFFCVIGLAVTFLFIIDTFTKWRGLGASFLGRLEKVFIFLDAWAISRKAFITKHPYGLLVILFLVVIFLVGIVPMFAEYLYSDLGTKKGQKHPFDVVNESRKTIAQIIGGIVAIVAFYFMWERNRLTAQGQITERFTQAVEQLGNKESIAIRLGGIYALERIARDSKEDHWSVMEVLTAYVREKCPVEEEVAEAEAAETKEGAEAPKTEKKRELPKDIQAILDVIGRREHTDIEGDRKINLARTDLRGAFMGKKGEQEVNFRNAIFYGSDLRGVPLIGAKLQGANLIDAKLQGANLIDAKLQG